MNELQPPHEGENKPFHDIRISDSESIPAYADETVINTYLAEKAIYDHIIVTKDDIEPPIVTRVWYQLPPNNPDFLAMLDPAIKAGAEAHFNLKKVDESTKEAFQTYSMKRFKDDTLDQL